MVWRLARALVVATAVGVALWGGPFRPSPRLQYERACSVLDSHPARAELLLRGLIGDAGGDFPDAQLQLALLAIERGDWGELDANCTSLDWDRTEAYLLMRLGGKAMDGGRIDVARQCFTALRHRQTPCSIAGLQGMAQLYDREQRPDEALRCREEITKIVPNNAYFWRLLAEARAARRLSAAAAAAYRPVLRQPLRRREEADIRARLVAQLIAAGDAAAAREELQRLASADDNLTPEVLALIRQLDKLDVRSSSSEESGPP
jgi:predicted Zn-dependent protease